MNLFFCFRREKEEGGENDKDNDDDAIRSGFVPIDQAVKNAEVRSTADIPTNGKI
jgi:hypothetical protein